MIGSQKPETEPLSEQNVGNMHVMHVRRLLRGVALARRQADSRNAAGRYVVSAAGTTPTRSGPRWLAFPL